LPLETSGAKDAGSDGYGKSWNPADHYRDIKIAEEYDRTRFSGLAGRVFDSLEKRAIQAAFADLPAGAHIVDAPCGTGRLAEVMLARGFRVTGMDISPAMLEVAKRKLSRFGGQFQVRIADLRHPPTFDDRFDAALCARVLMHFPLPEQITFLSNVSSLVRSRIVFTQGVDTTYHRMRHRLKGLLPTQRPAVYPVRPAELRELIAGASLRELRRHWPCRALTQSVVVVAESNRRA
jgi:SAM-dependent methyltransferase